MATHSYRLINVFTRGPEAFSGNPLCVFENGAAFDDAAMQALARQFNLSETTFILPSSHANARVRIFTPYYEMPFAGHPTLGTAHVCRALGLGGNELTLEMKVGVIRVIAEATDRWALQAGAPRWREPAEPLQAIAAMLGLQPRDIGERPLWVNAGYEQLIVPLTSVDAVHRACPDPQALNRLHGNNGDGMAYVFAARDAARPMRGAVPADATRRDPLVARFFFTQGPAVLEDPATGSAAANLGGWCIALGRGLPCRFEIAQGEQAARPSALYLDVDADRRVFVSGKVIELGRGTITIPD